MALRLLHAQHRIATSNSLLRYYATLASKAILPPLSEWKKLFPSLRGDARNRVLLHNKDTADRIATAFLNDQDYDQHSGQGRVVVEAFPGPGALSRAILKHPPSVVRKLIILEENELYLDYLKELEKIDPRVTVVPLSGYTWSTYTYLEEQGLLADIHPEPWPGVHQGLQFIAQLPHSIHGEQLIAQLLRYVSEKSWLYKWGRVKLNFVMGQWVWERISSPVCSITRCKLGVIAEANTEFSQTLKPRLLAPYAANFYPYPESSSGKRFEARKIGQPMLATTFTPRAEPAIMGEHLDKWDFVLRKLFVLKSQALKTALPSLAAGAHNLLPILNNSKSDRYVDTSKKIRDLTVQDWQRILLVFREWPFAPDNLFIPGTTKERFN